MRRNQLQRSQKMTHTTRNIVQGFLIGLAMLGCLMLGIWHGKSIGDAKAILEYEVGYDAGWKAALYTRPVPEELEMVCLGLWMASLPERKDLDL
jgi:hypothetical protein